MINSNMKALYIVVNAGFAEQVVELVRSKGASGATIINARGISSLQKEIMGINIGREKEMILTLTSVETADAIMEAIRQNMEFKSESHVVCFTLPVSKTVGLRENLAENPPVEK